VVGTKGDNIRRDYPTNVRVPTTESGLPLETVFLGFQIRSLDAKRFPETPAGQLSAAKMTEVEIAVRYCLGL
jgi:mRNA interferase MazF